VWLARAGATGPGVLPQPASQHPAAKPILTVQAFYAVAHALSVARGYDPDVPPHLNKVTETV
jgi:glucosamine--fructose-6-phosphate aminotransferase (isomerizing)